MFWKQELRFPYCVGNLTEVKLFEECLKSVSRSTEPKLIALTFDLYPILVGQS